jgi:hypothetical protein
MRVRIPPTCDQQHNNNRKHAHIMYGIDDDFASTFNAASLASKQFTPFFPRAEYAGQVLLQHVRTDKGKKKGKFFEFEFQVTKSNNDAVQAGATYIMRFNQGAGEIDNAICWRNMTPILMAATGSTDILTFNAPEELGNLLSICKAEPGVAKVLMGLPMNHKRELEEARPNKDTGKLDPKHLEQDGVTVKKYPRDTYTPAQAA